MEQIVLTRQAFEDFRKMEGKPLSLGGRVIGNVASVRIEEDDKRRRAIAFVRLTSGHYVDVVLRSERK